MRTSMVTYGVNPVRSALDAGRVSRIRIGPKGLAGLHAASGRRLESVLPALNPRLAELVRIAIHQGIPVDIVDAAEIERAARGAVHQGVVADVVGERDAWTPGSIVASAHGPALVIVLDGIEDPQNVGAILRTADAAGVDGIVRQSRHAARLDGAAAKAAAGALLHVRVATVVNIARALDDLKDAGVWTVGLAGEAAEDYAEVDYTLPTALVIGAEGSGLRRLVRERCDRLVRIPIGGHVGSLNASVAAAVVLFEATRQRRAQTSPGHDLHR